MTNPETKPPFAASLSALAIVSILVIVVVMVLFAGGADLLLPTLVLNGLVLILWLLSAAGMGSLVMRAVRIKCAGALRGIIATALGLGIISLVTLLLGCAGALNRVSAIAILAIGVIGALVTIPRKSTAGLWASIRNRLQRPAQFHWLWIAIAPIFAISTICALLPPGILWRDEPIGYDVTEYHLQVPREWFEAGRIIPLHHNVFSYFPFNVEMHYLLAMHLMGGPWAGMYLAQLMHVCFIALTVIAVWALLAEKHPRGAIIAGVFAGATPWLALLAPVAYNEGGLLLFGTLAIGLAIRALEEEKPLKWMILAGAMAGFACGSKLTAGPMILLPLPLIIALVRFAFPSLPSGEGRGEDISVSRTVSASQRPLTLTLSRRKRGQEAFLLVIGFVLAAALTLSPWLVRNVIWAHNPVFPEATSLFGKAYWTDTQVERWQRANHLPRLDQQNLPARVHAGWSQIFGDRRFGFILLPFAVIAIVLRRDRISSTLGALLLVELIFWLCFTHLQSRFFVLSIPVCALLIGRVQNRWWESASTGLALIAAVCGTLITTSKIAGIERDLAPFQIRLFSLTGLPSLRGFSRLPEAYDHQTVELVGEGQAFLYDIPMKQLYYRTVFDVDAQPGDTAQQAWRKGWPEGSDVMVITNDSELERFHRTYFGIP